jgi:hypothetical protein
LEFEREGEEARQRQADFVVTHHARRGERARELVEDGDDADPDDRRARRLDKQLQPQDEVDDRALDPRLARRADETVRPLLQ